jgi:hypothetical protein
MGLMGSHVRFNAFHVCSWAALLLAGLFAARNLATWPTRLAYPGEESYEGVGLAEIVHLRQGVPIYAPAAAGRYDAATYGPLYYILAGRFINPENPSYSTLRFFSTVGILGCATGCGLLAFWLTQSWQSAFLSPMVFLSYGMVSANGIQSHSDSVALLLAFSGFLLAYRFRGSRVLLFAVPFMIFSFYYKPQYVAGPLAVLLFLLLDRRYRLAAAFGGLLVFFGVGLFGLFQWVVFPGQAFWRHFLLSQASLLSWHRFGQALFCLSFMLLLPLLFGIEYLRAYPNKIVSCYLFFGVLLAVLTYSKDGSGLHYFFESVLLMSALVPVVIVKQIIRHVYPIEVLFVLGVMLFAGHWSTKPAPMPSDFVRHNAMQSFLRQNFPHHAEALSAYPGELLQAGLGTPFSSLFQLAQLARRGVISDQDLAASIRAHRFSVIILSFDLRKEQDPYWLNSYYLTPATREAIEHGYVLATSLDMPALEKDRPQDRYYIYVPGSNQ